MKQDPSTIAGALVRLSQSGLVLDGRDDIRGREVVDAQGDEVGSVDDLVIDQQEKRVCFVRIASGGFLGMGTTKFLVPVEAIARVDERVHLSPTRERVGGSPPYDPEILEPNYYDNLYKYYGFDPYWRGGLENPRWPL